MKAAILLGLVLGASATGQPTDEFKREGDGAKRAAKNALENKPPPPLQVSDWRNTEGVGLTLAEFKGNVILLDFWGAWCPPCRKSMPHLKELYHANKDRGLVVIGIHTSNPTDKMGPYIEEAGMDWPLAVDVRKQTKAAYQVDGYPDYYLIDRAGNLRVADLANAGLDHALEVLLNEAQPTLSRLERVEKIRENWAMAKFEVQADGIGIGSVRLINKIVGHVDGPYLEFIDDIDVLIPGAHYVRRLITNAVLDEAMTPTQAMATGLAQNENIDYMVNIENGKLTGRVGLDNIVRNVPSPFATDSTILRLASVMDFEEGARYVVHGIDGDGGKELEPDQLLVYSGTETVALFDEELREERRAHRIVHKRADRKVEATYWFDDERRMIKLATDFVGVGPIEWALLPPRDPNQFDDDGHGHR